MPPSISNLVLRLFSLMIDLLFCFRAICMFRVICIVGVVLVVYVYVLFFVFIVCWCCSCFSLFVLCCWCCLVSILIICFVYFMGCLCAWCISLCGRIYWLKVKHALITYNTLLCKLLLNSLIKKGLKFCLLTIVAYCLKRKNIWPSII